MGTLGFLINIKVGQLLYNRDSHQEPGWGLAEPMGVRHLEVLNGLCQQKAGSMWRGPLPVGGSAGLGSSGSSGTAPV